VATSAAARYTATYRECEDVLALFSRHRIQPDLITYNTLLNALSYCADSPEVRMPMEEAMKVVRQMEAAGVAADVVTFSTVLRVCAKATEAGRASMRDADAVLQLMRRRKLLAIDTVLCNTFLECARADGSASALELAEDMLSRMPAEDCDSYTYATMMLLYGKVLGARGGLRALQLLQEALQGGIGPNRYLFNAAMAAQLPHSPRNVLRLRDEMVEHDIEADRRSRELIRDAELLLRRQGFVEGFVAADREEFDQGEIKGVWEVMDDDDDDDGSS